MAGRILDSHSCIACPFELSVPSILGRRHWKYGIAATRARVIADAYGVSWRLVRAPRLPLSFLMRPRLEKFLKKILKKEGKDLFIVKEPNHLVATDRIINAFGRDAVIVFLRGPLGTAYSLMHRFADEDPLRTWATAHRELLCLIEQGCFFVKYEDILQSPTEVFTKTCDFLGVDYEPTMLEYGKVEHADDKLPLWHRGQKDLTFVPLGQAALHETLSRGAIDPSYNAKRIGELPERVVDAYRRDAHGSRTIAEKLGYHELS